jgi:hypothetical protein
MPHKVLLKLRETRLSRHKQLRRAIPLWFVCVFEAARARRGRPGDALVEESEFPCVTTPQDTRHRERAAPRRAKSQNEAQTKPQPRTRRCAGSALRSRVRRVPARAAGSEGASAARREERSKRQNTRRPRTATKESGLPVASHDANTPRAPHRASRAPLVSSWCARAACRWSRGAERR